MDDPISDLNAPQDYDMFGDSDFDAALAAVQASGDGVAPEDADDDAVDAFADGVADASPSSEEEPEQPAEDAPVEAGPEGEADAEPEAEAEAEPAYDVLAAYRELNPGTTATNPADVIAEVGAQLAAISEEREGYRALDPILQDPATQAFLRARMDKKDALEAAAIAGLTDIAPDPEEDPEGYAQWTARRAVAEVQRASDAKAAQEAADRLASHTRRANELRDTFLASERLTDEDRRFAVERTRLLYMGSADGLTPPRPDLLMDAVLKQRDFDKAVADAEARGRAAGAADAAQKLAAKAPAKQTPPPSPRGGGGGSATPSNPELADLVKSFTAELY
jgi:hypothetical protein